MLAQSFLDHATLGITEVERDALVKVLGMLERGEIKRPAFYMATFFSQRSCGTVACICGWAHIVSDGCAFPELGGPLVRTCSLAKRLPAAARALFGVTLDNEQHKYDLDRVRHDAQPRHAAVALRSYLTTGEANWADALGSTA